jgi:hypothetical protein
LHPLEGVYMSIRIPSIDDRRYQDLLDEALARIPVHNPEWTNFNKSDPGVTILEIFAFLTETLLYRANQIPERNRRKFLSLLGITPRPMRSAHGLVSFSNERGPLEAQVFAKDLEVFAGQVPFRTSRGLEVLPIEARVYIKREISVTTDQQRYYDLLYRSFQPSTPSGFKFYETVPMDGSKPLDLAGSVDKVLWLALLAREKESPEAARKQIAKRTLSIGIVPALDEAARVLKPQHLEQLQSSLVFEVPKGGVLGSGAATYQPISARVLNDVLSEPGVVELSLPDESGLGLWQDINPLEAGVGDLPPALDDKLAERLITWLRIRPLGATQARFLWVGINAAMLKQRAKVVAENLPSGTGEPDQSRSLAQTPVIPGSVHLRSTLGKQTTDWFEVDDLMNAAPEVPSENLELPPGQASQSFSTPSEVFSLDPINGELRFGDGARGRRPAFGANLQVSYDCGVGRVGNVAVGAINQAPSLPAGFKLNNPVRTWGGADAQTLLEAEKGIRAYLQHRDRLVSALDFEAITHQTPGVEIGRVEVLPAFNPENSSLVGNTPGAVTLLLIPKFDPLHPDAPMPDRLFLDTICAHLEPRRIVTSEVYLRGPKYVGVQVSVGFTPEAGVNPAEVREAIKLALRRFLSPLPSANESDALSNLNSITGLPAQATDKAGIDGWALGNPVLRLELEAVVNRVPGVRLVNELLLGSAASTGSSNSIPMLNLELPQLTALEAVVGAAVSLEELRGETSQQTGQFLPVPIVPEECR